VYDAQARSAEAPTEPDRSGREAGPLARPRITAPPEVIERLLRSDDLFKPTRAERNAAMPRALRATSTALNILAIAMLGFAVYLGIVSRLHYDRAQFTAYSDFRSQLALATAPIGHADPDDPTKSLAVGAPVAVIEIPSIGLKQVVFEGTSGSVLESGPGHLRNTPLPGQAGTSVLFGRSSMYGGPFNRIDILAPDDTITVTTGQGLQTFKVLGVRRPGDRQPPPLPSGAGRLTLVTAEGNPFVASDVIRVDADLTSPTQPTPAPTAGPVQLTQAELPMATDDLAWFPLIGYGAGLLIVTSLAGWSRYGWGGPQTWIVCAPVIVALGLATADQVTRLLPNLI
jgi:LPXTG-site transpeptidase (sortase) family protein